MSYSTAYKVTSGTATKTGSGRFSSISANNGATHSTTPARGRPAVWGMSDAQSARSSSSASESSQFSRTSTLVEPDNYYSSPSKYTVCCAGSSSGYGTVNRNQSPSTTAARAALAVDMALDCSKHAGGGKHGQGDNVKERSYEGSFSYTHVPGTDAGRTYQSHGRARIGGDPAVGAGCQLM
jgi:hypothetical protein